MNDIVTGKIQSIQRCIERAREEYSLAGETFRADYSRQDAAVMNITRACELAIDLANFTIKTVKLGVPASSAESFELLVRKKVIPSLLEKKMINMVGFRNIAIHEYRKLDIEIVEAIIRIGLGDLIEFTDCVMGYLKNAPES